MAAPPGNQGHLDFNTALSPPDGDVVELDFNADPHPLIQVGAGDQSAFGIARLDQPRFLKALGWQSDKFGIPPYPIIGPGGFTAYPPGWSSSVVSTLASLSITSFLFPTGIASSSAPATPSVVYGGGYQPPPGSTVILNFTDLLNPPPGGAVVLEFEDIGDGSVLGATLGDQTLFGTALVGGAQQILTPGIVSTSIFGIAFVSNYSQEITVSGLTFPSPQIGPGIVVKNYNQYLAPYGPEFTAIGAVHIANLTTPILASGIAPPAQTAPNNGNRQVPNPVVDFYTRYLNPTGIGPLTFPSPYIAHYVQFISVTGVAPPVIPTHVIDFTLRTIYPDSVLGIYWGTAVVKRQQIIYPNGWIDSSFSDNHELVFNTRKIYHTTGEADPAGYGVATFYNSDTLTNVLGFLSQDFAVPIIYNDKQIITVKPYNDNLNPDKWGIYYPFVENVDRIVAPFGHQDSKFSLSHWIHNAAEPVKAGGIDFTLWGVTRVEHLNRTVYGIGFNDFYSSNYHVVHNDAAVIGPVTLGNQSGLGYPNPVLNLNRVLKHHSGFEGPEFGTAYIDYAIRTVYQNVFNDIYFPIPLIQHNPNPIAPLGIPWLGGIGAHEVVEYFKIIYAKSTNVHPLPWIGEPFVENKNKTIKPYAYDFSEFGYHKIQNYIQNVNPVGTKHTVFGGHIIKYWVDYLSPPAISPPSFPVKHKLEKDSPDPPSLQYIVLATYDDENEPTDGLGIAPPSPFQMGTPAVRMQTIYPPSILTVAVKFGQAKVTTNAIAPPFIFEDGLFGIPTLNYPRIVNVFLGIKSELVIPLPRFTPFNIYAPSGDQKPPGYNPKNGGPVINSVVIFGNHVITNKHRTIGPIPNHSGDPGLTGKTKFGDTKIELFKRYIFAAPIKSLKWGQIIFLNVPQYIDFASEGSEPGIASTIDFGQHHVAHYIPPDGDQYVYPVGLASLLAPSQKIELFNRTIFPSGVPHRGNPQQNLTSPWGNHLVGYPRKVALGGYSFTLWGNTIIEFKIRHVYPVGFNSCSLEDNNYDDFKSPMKFTRTNPKYAVPSIQSGEKFGNTIISLSDREIYPQGFKSEVIGATKVKAKADIFVDGWYSTLFGDIDEWEAGKIKPYGDDLGVMGTPKVQGGLNVLGIGSESWGEFSVASGINPIGIPNIGFDGPALSNPFGCTNRVVVPLPILSIQNVPSPEVAYE